MTGVINHPGRGPRPVAALSQDSASLTSVSGDPSDPSPISMKLVPLHFLKKFYELDIAKNMAFCLLEIPVLMLIEMFYIEIMVTPWEGEFIYENVWMTVNNIVTFFVTLQYSMHAVRYFLLNAHPCLNDLRNAVDKFEGEIDHVTIQNHHFKILGYLSKLSGLNFGKCLYLLCVFFIQIASISKFALVFMIGTRYIMLDKYDLFNDPEIYDWYDSNMGTKVDWWETPNSTEHEFAQTLDVTQIMNVGGSKKWLNLDSDSVNSTYSCAQFDLARWLQTLPKFDERNAMGKYLQYIFAFTCGFTAAVGVQ